MSNRPSYAQLEGLVEFLEENPGIARGVLRTTHGKLQTKRKWETLANTLNCLGGAIKNGQGWAKYWAEKKCALKKHCADLSASMTRTGGGTDNLAVLSALDNRLVAVMGGQEFATRDTILTVDPFPQSSAPVVENILIPAESAEMDSSTIITSHNEAVQELPTIPAPATPLQSTLPQRPRRRRSSIQRTVDIDMQQMTDIEARRVEAELITAQALTKLSESVSNIGNALLSIANAISEVARKMPSQ
ncbi:uncharacterized protein LOC123700425 isoform X2 [Colias croceus]|nr:uncharacterized protein LOC123700425 isoform X2 [Colias croceus]